MFATALSQSRRSASFSLLPTTQILVHRPSVDIPSPVVLACPPGHAILSATAPILQIKFDGRFSSSVFTTTRHADGSMDLWIDEECLPYIVLYIHPWLTRLPTYVHQLLHDNLGALPLTSSRIHTIYCTPESISSDWARGPSYAVLTSTLPQTHRLSSPRLLSMFKIFSRLHRSKIW